MKRRKSAQSRATPLPMNTYQANVWKVKLKEVMKARNLSAQELSERAGLGSTTIRHLVGKGETVTLETLRRVADAVDLPLTYFVTGNAFIVQDLVGGSRSTAHKIYVLPIHGPNDIPGEDYGKGFVPVLDADAGMAPYALRQGDRGTVGPAEKAPPHEATVMPGDILFYDALRRPKAGDLVVVNLSRGKTPNFSARQLVVEDDDLFAAPLSSEFERIRVERGAIAGVVRQLQRSFIA